MVLVLASSVRAQSLHRAARGEQALNAFPRVSVTVLADNMAGPGPVLGEWCVAFLIETDQHQILFDWGGGR